MSRILNAASVAAVGLTVAATLLLAEPGFATDLGADANTPVIQLPGAETPMKAETADLSTDAPVAPPTPDSIDQTEPEAPEPAPVTLAALVDATPMPATIDPELRCLAGAVYFESRGESLAGQLAVAHVIINRAESGRSEEHTSELQSLMRISYAVFCLKKKINSRTRMTLLHTLNYTTLTTHRKELQFHQLTIADRL